MNNGFEATEGSENLSMAFSALEEENANSFKGKGGSVKGASHGQRSIQHNNNSNSYRVLVTSRFWWKSSVPVISHDTVMNRRNGGPKHKCCGTEEVIQYS